MEERINAAVQECNDVSTSMRQTLDE
eukprot:COSAG01_NODE_23364_length_818_cov_0.859527_1_plen_25_part_10